jgi:hypothetical protein
MIESDSQDRIIATITNTANPSQVISIKYLRSESAFCTSGIRAFLGLKEILIPVYLVEKDFQLIGSIVSAILERISQAAETGTDFVYAERFEALGKQYTLSKEGEFMKLEDQVV